MLLRNTLRPIVHGIKTLRIHASPASPSTSLLPRAHPFGMPVATTAVGAAHGAAMASTSEATRRSSRRTSNKSMKEPSESPLPSPKPSTASIARKASRKIVQEVAQENEAPVTVGASSAQDDSSDAGVEKTKARGKGRAAAKAGTKRRAAAAEAESKPLGDSETNGQGVVEDEPELDSDGEPVRRAKNGRRLPKKKQKKEKIYIIPEVEKRDFRQEYRPDSMDSYSSREARRNGFVGRLGYACLNTVLRTADPPVFSSRTARLRTIDEKGLDFVKELARQNARDIVPMLQWNAANNIRFMRLSSEIFPFASHATYGYSPDCCKEELAEAGRVARSLNHRVTMHPGQFVQLGSPNEAVVKASIAELEVHAAVLDLMGMDQDSVMIIHGGGVYQDRPATLERMRATIRDKLPTNVRNRLVLENDEISWSAEELLPVCHEFNIPMVFDFHHDMLRPSKKTPRELMPELLELFRGRGIKPKFHLSHPRPGSRNLRERRAHSDRCGTLPLDLPPDADLMIEAKDKEQAVLELYRIYNLFPVDHSVLRPPADDITTSTSGRRKVLNGSGGASQQVEDDADGAASPAAPARKRQETEAEKMKRAIEHSKRIAAKRGVDYTGPEYVDETEARRLAGPVLGIAETMAIMEVEAQEIREELKRGTGRALSEIREDVEQRIEGTEQDAPSSPSNTSAGGRSSPPALKKSEEAETAAKHGGGSHVPKEEIMQDPSEHNVPGEEEKVPYHPIGAPRDSIGTSTAAAAAAPVTPAKPATENGNGPPHTVIVPTSADKVDKYL